MRRGFGRDGQKTHAGIFSHVADRRVAHTWLVTPTVPNFLDFRVDGVFRPVDCLPKFISF
jgi:hypothetical protein